MFRICLITIFLSGLVIGAAAQSASPSGTSAPSSTTRPTKGASPKATPNSKQISPVDAGPCEIGLISAAANRFGVQQVGFTMFGNEYYITVYDGQSFEVIKKGAAATDDEPMMSRLLAINPISGPNQELDETAFPSAPAEAAANQKLRDGVRNLLTTSLDRTLPRLLQQ